MQNLVKQSVFNTLMKKLQIEPAETEAEKFNDWMKSKVKSIHYANTGAMLEAYKRINNNQ